MARVAIVTGAAQGIGLAYARGLAADGLRVVVADIKREKAEAAAAEIRAEGGDAIGAHVDVSEMESAQQLARLVQERYGRLDVLVNNAAIFEGMKLVSAMTCEVEYWRRLFRVNVDGVLVMTQALAPLMIANKYGRIVNQSSTAAYGGGGDPYGAGKLVVNRLTLGFAGELGQHGITVNAIAPGPVPTDAMKGVVPAAMIDALVSATPISRVGSTDDMVNALRFLASEQSGWISGQIICVDGGYIKRL